MLDIDPNSHYQSTPTTASSPYRHDEEALVKQYLPLVKRVVGQLKSHTSPYFTLEDMQQIGLIGLLEAGRRYENIDDPHFPAFAVCRIRGSILDELRRLDWRSRQTRQQAHELNDITRDLTKQLKRQPSEAEVIEALGTSKEDYQQRLQASLASEMQSLDQLIDSGTFSQNSDPSCSIKHEFNRRTLKVALSKLNKREQLLLTLFYQHDLNLHEIALVLNLTPPRICQLHKQALKQLNNYLSQ